MVLDVGDDVSGESERPDLAALDGAFPDPVSTVRAPIRISSDRPALTESTCIGRA